jgi:hypothetical protein
MGEIEVRRVGEGVRHYLDDRPIEDGVTLDLLLAGQRWLTGSYRLMDGRGVRVRGGW